MVLIILIANNKQIMGKFVSKKFGNIAGWIIVLFMSMAGIFLLVDLIRNLVS